MVRIRCFECGGTIRVEKGYAGRSGRCPHCGANIVIPPDQILALDGRVCANCGVTLYVAETIHIHWGRLLCDFCYAEVLAEQEEKADRSSQHTKTAVFNPGETARSALRRHAELECDIKLAQLLMRSGLMDPNTLRALSATQRRTGKSLVSVLVDSNILSEKEIGSAIAKETKLPFSTAKCQYVDRGVRELLPLSVMTNYELVPLTRSADTVTIAMVNPLDEEALEEVERLTGLRVSPVICTLSGYRRTMARYFGVEENSSGGGGD